MTAIPKRTANPLLWLPRTSEEGAERIIEEGLGRLAPSG